MTEPANTLPTGRADFDNVDRADDAAAEAERERLADALRQIVWTARADGVFDWASRSLYRYVGADVLDLPGGEWLTFVHDDERDAVQATWAAAVVAGTPFSVEFRVRRHDGMYRWHLVTNTPIRGTDGRVMRWYGTAIDMHDRKVTEEALRSSEARMRVVLATEPECVKLVSADGVLLEMNPAGLSMIEAESAADVIGHDVTELVHPADRAAFASLHKRVSGGGTGRLEFRIVGLRGSTRWMETNSAPIDATSGRRASVLSVTHDVTDRKRLEMVRDAENEILEMVSSGAALGDVLHKVAVTVDVASSSASSIRLVEHGELRNCVAPNVAPEYSRQLEGQPIGPRSGSCGTAAHRREVVIVTDIATDPLWDADRHLALAHGLAACWSTPVLDSSGDVVATLAQYFETPRPPSDDDRRLVERLARIVSIAIERIRTDEALRESEERFRIIAKATSDVVWDWDILTGAVWRSDGLADLLGAEGIDATRPSWQSLVHPDDIARVDGGLAATLDSGAKVWSDGYRILRADGSVATVSERGHIVRDDGGRAVRVVGSTVDRTRERHLEEQLEQSQRLEAVGQLTGGVAHDFNNLLTVILGSAELLIEELEEGQHLRVLAEMVKAAAERGAELTNRLLAFGRRQPLDPTVVDIDRLLEGLDPLLRRALGEDIEIETIRDASLWAALVDAPQLEAAVLNLCLNARDAMVGGGRLTIETANVDLDRHDADTDTEVLPGQYVMIAVSDAGEGMTADVAAHAFEPFFTTKAVGRGSGLGLSMVYGFAKQSGGHIQLSSQLGQGTTVSLYLPRSTGVANARADRPDGAAHASGTETILVVEDDGLVRAHVRGLLEGLGYRVICTATTADALAVIDGGEPVDLLFTDIVMPGGMNGSQLADEVRARRPAMPVLFTSGYSENTIVHGGRLDAGVLLLNKPYRLHELASRVRAALTR